MMQETSRQMIFFDLETGGLKIGTHPVIQIAAIAAAVTPNGFEIGRTFERKLLFNVEECDPRALEINSFDADVWESEGVMQAGACADFSSFLKSHATLDMTSKTGKPYRVAELCAYNGVSFDKPHLWKLYSRQRESWVPAHPQVYDPLQLAKWTFYGRSDAPANFKMATVAKHLGLLEEDEEQSHDALDDVRLLVKITDRLTRMIHIEGREKWMKQPKSPRA